MEQDAAGARPHTARIVVGVVPGQPPTVVAMAARFAAAFQAELVCASVDAARYPVEAMVDGTVLTMPIDPDLGGVERERFDPDLWAMIAGVLDPLGVPWSVQALAGGPAQELARLADRVDAEMIVVGTRERGFVGSVREFVNGSVATQLAHRQRRPVVVVPLGPVGPGGVLPWEAGEA